MKTVDSKVLDRGLSPIICLLNFECNFAVLRAPQPNSVHFYCIVVAAEISKNKYFKVWTNKTQTICMVRYCITTCICVNLRFKKSLQIRYYYNPPLLYMTWSFFWVSLWALVDVVLDLCISQTKVYLYKLPQTNFHTGNPGGLQIQQVISFWERRPSAEAHRASSILLIFKDDTIIISLKEWHGVSQIWLSDYERLWP